MYDYDRINSSIMNVESLHMQVAMVDSLNNDVQVNQKYISALKRDNEHKTNEMSLMQKNLATKEEEIGTKCFRESSNKPPGVN